MKSSAWARVCVLAALALFLASGLAWGQAGTATIRGEITDPQGKLIPKATVKITNESTGQSRTQETTAGAFSFDLVPPGDYTIEIEARGFKKTVLTHVHALVGSPVDVSTQMELGAVGETVQVEAGASAVQMNTQDASLGNNFVNKQISQLPLEARNILSLLTLQPGVTREGYVAGARSDQSNITLDGVDINEAQNNSLGLTGGAGSNALNPPANSATDHPVLRLNSEAIEEFRVTTLNANANQGRSSGAQINLVTKSGTNSFHGSAFEFHRNTIFTANDFFNNRSGVARPKLIRNTFGGAVGGPVMKDKVFFFYSYEGRRDASGASALRIVPLPDLGQGQMRVVARRCTDPVACPQEVVTLSTAQLNQIFPSVGLNSAAISALANAASKYPANDFTTGDSNSSRLLNTAGFRFNAPTSAHLNSHVAKLDWNITSNQTAFIRVNVLHDLRNDLPGLLKQFPDTTPPNLWEHPWGLAASHTWTIHQNWVNNFRYGLTRQAFSQLGDSSENAISFRFIFSPLAFSRTVSRTTPVHNFVDDVSWVKGSHTIQFGTNIRVTRNSRASFGNAFDNAITNPSFYQKGGKVISDPIKAFLAANGFPVLVSTSGAQNAATALIGRFSQYTANFTFAHEGSLLPSGTPTNRTFATENYDFYIQDAWRIRRNITLSYGLRYNLGRPLYETHGFEVKPDIPLDEFLKRRIFGAAAGTPYLQLITLELSGPANHKSPLYNWDYNNFQPRVAIAWQPNFDSGWLRKIFGGEGKSVIRSGFAITNDYYGQALAVQFDLNNTLGFSSNFTIPANTFNVTSSPAPPFTGFGQAVRPLPLVNIPGPVSFPRQQPADNARRIESGLDSGLVAPKNYMWNLTVERELPAGMVFSASYIGRIGRNLLATRDVMALNNLRDPKSGMDWYTAATILEKIRQTGVAPSSSIAPIPYFENVFPANLTALLNACCEQDSKGNPLIPANFTPTQAVYFMAFNDWQNDWTDLQDEVEFATGTNFFFNPQYGALSSWGTFAKSYYNALAVSVRQRYHSIQWDFNYTLSHSFDNASGLQTSGTYGGAFVLNPIRPNDWYGNSDFDVRHAINVNAIYELPIGRGHWIAGGASGLLDALIGGWQLSGIFRWNTGVPISAPFDDARWATNWNVQSDTTLTKALQPCVTRGSAAVAPKLFGCDTQTAYQSFRNAFPGESGQRNIFRLPGYVNLDTGLGKAFTMPWSEKQKLQLRWEVFNVTNTQHFGILDATRTGFGMTADPALSGATPPPNWSNFTGIQGAPRVMQIGIRFEF